MASFKRPKKGRGTYLVYKQTNRLAVNKARKAAKEHKKNLKLQTQGKGVYAKNPPDGV